MGNTRRTALMILEKVEELLRDHAPNLARSIGALPVRSLPPAGTPGVPYPPINHTHPEYIDQAELDAHVAAADPHPQYQTEPDGDARYLQLSSVSLTAGVNIVPRAGVAGKLAVGWLPSHASTHASGGTDPITPLSIGAAAASHQHAASDTTSGVFDSARLPVAPSGTGSPGTIVSSLDLRLNNARTPTSHAASHASGGTDPITPLSIGAAQQQHSHDLTELPVAASGTSSATLLVRADDSRLSNSRTPTAHATSHATGGSDPITPLSIGAAALTAVQTFTGAQTIRHGSGYGTVLTVASNANDIRFEFATSSNGSASFGTATNHNFGINVAGVQRVFFGASGAVLIGRTSGLTGAGDLDVNGRVRGATLETTAGNQWTLGGHTAGALAATGYVSVVVDGVTRRFLTG